MNFTHNWRGVICGLVLVDQEKYLDVSTKMRYSASAVLTNSV